MADWLRGARPRTKVALATGLIACVGGLTRVFSSDPRRHYATPIGQVLHGGDRQGTQGYVRVSGFLQRGSAVQLAHPLRDPLFLYEFSLPLEVVQTYPAEPFRLPAFRGVLDGEPGRSRVPHGQHGIHPTMM